MTRIRAAHQSRLRDRAERAGLEAESFSQIGDQRLLRPVRLAGDRLPGGQRTPFIRCKSVVGGQ